MPLVSFSSGQVISSASVNQNFGICVLTDTSRTIAVTHTWTASQTFSGGWTAAAGCTISSGSLVLGTAASRIVPGATSLSLRNNADTQDNVLITDAGLVTLRGNLSFTNTPARIFMPSAGSIAFRDAGDTVDRLLVTANGDLVPQRDLAFLPAAAHIVGGATSLALRNSANTLDNLLVTDAGVVTVRSNLVFAQAATKILPGATSVTFRNNADTQSNVLIADNGDTTIRGNIQMTAGTALLGTSGHQLVSATYGAGYTNAWTGAAANAATGYDASTITLPQLAARVRALQESLTTHGLIGV